MAKAKVVVSKEYLEVLIDKADAYEMMFDDEDGNVVVTPGDFKANQALTKRFNKVDTRVEDFIEPKPVKP